MNRKNSGCDSYDGIVPIYSLKENSNSTHVLSDTADVRIV